jgi:hypothetical protein
MKLWTPGLVLFRSRFLQWLRQQGNIRNIIGRILCSLVGPLLWSYSGSSAMLENVKLLLLAVREFDRGGLVKVLNATLHNYPITVVIGFSLARRTPAARRWTPQVAGSRWESCRRGLLLLLRLLLLLLLLLSLTRFLLKCSKSRRFQILRPPSSGNSVQPSPPPPEVVEGRSKVEREYSMTAEERPPTPVIVPPQPQTEVQPVSTPAPPPPPPKLPAKQLPTALSNSQPASRSSVGSTSATATSAADSASTAQTAAPPSAEDLLSAAKKLHKVEPSVWSP